MLQARDLHWEPCGEKNLNRSHAVLEGLLIHAWRTTYFGSFWCLNRVELSGESEKFAEWASYLVFCNHRVKGCRSHGHRNCVITGKIMTFCAQSVTWEGIVAILEECENRSVQALQHALTEDM